MINIENDKEALYQWEKNRRIILTNIKAGVLVDFLHEKFPELDNECPCVKSFEEDGKVYAFVPNLFLQKSGIIKVYIRVQENETEYTEHYTEIFVLYRPKPSDYIYTEIEIYNFESVVNKALQKAKENGEFKGDPGDKGDKGESGVYMLSEDETLENVPDDFDVVIDPNGDGTKELFSLIAAQVDERIEEYINEALEEEYG